MIYCARSNRGLRVLGDWDRLWDWAARAARAGATVTMHRPDGTLLATHRPVRDADARANLSWIFGARRL